MIQPETRYANVGDDRVAYQVLGDGPIDLVATPGQWGHLDLIWEEPTCARFFRRLAAFSRLIRFDARGGGLSDARPAGRDVTQHWNRDLLSVLDAVHAKPAAILGWLDGTSLALQFAATYPDRVRALALFNPVARYTAAPDYPQGNSAEDTAKYLAFTRKYWGTEKWALANSPSLANDERALYWFARFQRATASPRAIVESHEIMQQLDARPILPDIRVPTLVIGRGNDRWTSLALTRYVAEHIPGARFVEVPGGDTMMFWETPDLILDHIEEFVTGQRHGGELDRMLTAVLFTDIVGSTVQAAKLGDAAWRALLDRHDHTLREQVGLFGGKVADHSGDGSLSTFGNPRCAIECALALRKALAAIGVEIRAGVHFGEVEKRAEGGVGGVNVHVGARVMALAGAGEVLVSHTVQSILLGSRYVFGERGAHELKGVPGKWPVYAVGAGKHA